MHPSRRVRTLRASSHKQCAAFWDGYFWLKTPRTYDGLNFSLHGKQTHRCNIYCKFDLKAVSQANDAHYTIAVVRAQDGVHFHSNSVLYSQNDIQSQQMILHSTVKF